MHLSPRIFSGEPSEGSLARGASVSSQASIGKAACLNTLPCVAGVTRGQEIIQRILESGSLMLLHAELGQTSALLLGSSVACNCPAEWCLSF
jgi:hypothetical protein